MHNYDYNLNGGYKDLKLADPAIYMEAVGDVLGAHLHPHLYQFKL